MIDLRSDTITLPTKGMMHAISVAKLGDDVLNEDPTIHELEKNAYSENQNIIQKALEYSKNFTWLSCAKKTFDIYSEIK